jgi:hypothetical protein
MTTRLPQAPFIRTALVVLAVATIVLLASLVRAIRITPVAAAESPANAELVRVTTVPAAPDIDLDAVGANGIFQPDRTALPYRYRMPGEQAPDAGDAPPPILPVVLGTVIATDSAHFATVQLPGGRPTVLRVKDQIGEYTITSIQRGKVVFRNAAGKLVEITATRPGPR